MDEWTLLIWLTALISIVFRQSRQQQKKKLLKTPCTLPVQH